MLHLPFVTATLSPAALAVGLFLSTFVLEDAAAIGGGLLLAAGSITWPAAYSACFLGIWLGDAGLYALARVCGRSWLARTRWHRHAERVARSERWFASRGDSILIVSRLLPGARLPTYLAAGFLRLPLQRFLLVTAAASVVWTGLVLLLAQQFGEALSAHLGAWQRAGGCIVVAVLSGWAARPAARLAKTPRARRWATWLARWRHWEFWPAWLFYPPVVFYCAWLALRHRGLTLPTLANPGMFSGGVVGESKGATLQDLMATSPEFTAPAEVIGGACFKERVASLREIRQRLRIELPFILKPDVGQRGAGVRLVRSEPEAEAYLRQTAAPVLVQAYVPGPYEVGVFYYRFPHESRGRVFAITEKVFPILVGDGQATLEELIWNDPRARFMAATYLRRFAGRRQEVLPAGSKLKLVEAGNHAQGCIFRDGLHLLTPELEARVDVISRRLSGFCIGRYDIRYGSPDELSAGRGFQIVELNGAAAEATNIYDACHSLVSAYRILFQQWNLVFAIGAANRRRGCPRTRLTQVWRIWRSYLRQAATYPVAD